MTGCTAPRRGHHSSAARAACPVCGRSSRRPAYPAYQPPAPVSVASGGGSSRRTTPGGGGSGGSSGSSGGPSRRTRSGTVVVYTPAEWRAVEPFAQSAATQAELYPQKLDLFLCHAWDDRKGAARELNDELLACGATVWFSEDQVGLGVPLMREIDRGLTNTRIGLVLVTPAFLKGLAAQRIADKELSVLLATNRVIPVALGTTFEDINEVSPLLASRVGLTVGDELSLQEAAAQVAAIAAAAKDLT